jgi:Family of unknown function (DUF6230)
MTDADSRPVVGKTRWRRFWLVLAPCYAAVAGLVYMVATGALAVSFVISSSAITVTADSLTAGAPDGNGQAFYQFGIADFDAAGAPHPTVESIIPNATLVNLCQSVTVGPLTLRTTAGGTGGSPVTATNLVTDATSTSAGNATFNNIRVGQDMSTFGNPALSQPVGRGTGPNVATGPLAPGTFGQVATGATLTGLRQTAQGTSAGTFTLPNLTLAFGAPC